MYYILHGEEEFTRSEQVNKLKARVMEDGLGDLNIAELDGRHLTLRELREACDPLPFLSERRLVIVEGMLSRLGPRPRGRRGQEAAPIPESDKELAQALLAYLPDLPPTTRLVFVEHRALPKRHPILKGVSSDEAYVQQFDLPDAGRLPRWITARSKQKGAEIERSAASRLAEYVGPNLRQLDTELEKLAAHANWSRPISERDVKRLVSASFESNIFGLVDALGLRQRRQAVNELQRLAENGANELYLLTMIERQIRLIISVKELVEEERQPLDAAQKQLRISHRFIVEKLSRQARRFKMRELEGILRSLAGIDQSIKTGQIDGMLALELLVVEVCSQGHSAPVRRR